MPPLEYAIPLDLAPRRRFGSMVSGFTMLLGLMLCATIALASIELGKVTWLASHGISALTIAIMLGIVVGNSLFPFIAKPCDTGVMFSKQNLLRLGIILYGFRVTFQDVGQVGIAGVAIDAVVLTSTFALAIILGSKVFRLDRDTTILIGAGSAICGAAAIMATEPIVRGRAEQVTVAVSTVVVFGTLGIFLYPLLYELNLQWHLIGATSAQFGVYIGSTVHEVAQVVAAGRSIDPDVANAAVIAKMVRVMMLAPFLLTLSVWRSRDRACAETSQAPKGRIVVPWFAFVFVAVVALHSTNLLPESVVRVVIDIDTMLLAMAMAALGLTTHVSAIRRAGVKPLMLAAILFIWLVAGGAAINQLMMIAIG